ncbi:MAG: hypothetical protein AAFO77_10690 [Pseudomonadota bacterium]
MFTRHTHKRDEIRAASVRTRLAMAVVLAFSTGLAVLGITTVATAATSPVNDTMTLAMMMVAPDIFAEPSNVPTVLAMTAAFAVMATGAVLLGKSLGRTIEAAGRSRVV